MSINANRKSAMGIPTSHRPRSRVTSNFPKWGSDIHICHFGEISLKKLKICYKVSLFKGFQQQSCSAVKYLSNGINILAGDDPVPVKFGPKSTDPH